MSEDIKEITPELIQSWKELKSEVLISVNKKDSFWLVPEYTEQDRVEISIDDYIKKSSIIETILGKFPDSKIIGVRKPKEEKK